MPQPDFAATRFSTVASTCCDAPVWAPTALTFVPCVLVMVHLLSSAAALAPLPGSLPLFDTKVISLLYQNCQEETLDTNQIFVHK